MNYPKAKKIPKILRKHNHERVDNYYWLNDREDSEVISTCPVLILKLILGRYLLSENEQDVPKQHSTLTLYGWVGEYLEVFINEELLSTFDDLYIDSRYPGNFGLLPCGKPTLEDAKEFYDLAKDIYEYIVRKIG